MRWFATEPRTYIKEKRTRRQWVRLWIRQRDSKGAYYSIINDLRLTDKENFWKKISEKPLPAIPILLFCLNKNQNYVFPLFSILYKWTLFMKKFFTTHASFCFYVLQFRKQKNIFCISEASLCFIQKDNFCIMNKIKLVWFYSLYRNNFLSKNVIFLYILKIFFTMLQMKIFLKYWIILYIFRISLCITSP